MSLQYKQEKIIGSIISRKGHLWYTIKYVSKIHILHSNSPRDKLNPGSELTSFKTTMLPEYGFPHLVYGIKTTVEQSFLTAWTCIKDYFWKLSNNLNEFNSTKLKVDSRLKTILFLPETLITVKWEDSSKTKNVASEEPPPKKKLKNHCQREIQNQCVSR